MLTLFYFLGHLGEVVEGMDIVKEVERQGSASGTPGSKVVISNCGVV